MVDKKGNFSKKLYIDGIQDITILLNNELLTFPASPGDIVDLNWDQQKLDSTLTLGSPSTVRANELKLTETIFKERFKPFMELRQKLATSKGLTDSAKYKLINESYDKEMALITATPDVFNNNPKAFYDNYFKHARLLFSTKLLKSFTLETCYNFSDSKYTNFSHTNLSVECFRLSNTYRDFIYDFVRSYRPFYDMNSDEISGGIISNHARSAYRLGQANIDIPLIRDWYLAKSLMASFGVYQYNEVEPLYDDYVGSGASQAYVDTVKTFYSNISKLKPGLPAPQFKLKNTNGKLVSLSDFKGKVVYINFWGVYCGPCLGDITENAAKVQEKYKNKDVVFINICVDEIGDAWKNKLKDLKFDGINLVAEGWTKNPVCKDYNINGIPHYVLIDRDGKLVNNNADGLWLLIGDEKNMLDKALVE